MKRFFIVFFILIMIFCFFMMIYLPFVAEASKTAIEKCYSDFKPCVGTIELIVL